MELFSLKTLCGMEIVKGSFEKFATGCRKGAEAGRDKNPVGKLIGAFIMGLFMALEFSAAAYAEAREADAVRSILPKFESFIQKAMHQEKIPGMAVAIASKGKILFLKGFGVRALGEKDPIDSQTLFQIGSTSKAISSTLIAVLKRAGQISLDEPIEAIPRVSLRHVLSHTTGIPATGFNALIESGLSPQEVQQKLQAIPREDAPGQKFAYHNVVYNLAATLIERHLGASFESILQERLLRPLQMTLTSSAWQSFILEKNKAFPHVVEKIRKKNGKVFKKTIRKAPYRKEYANFPAAGGFSSNIQDMALFLTALLGGRPDVVSPQDLDDFMRPLIHTPDQWSRTQNHRDRITQTHYGLGWRHMIFANQPVVFHGGWVRGFSAILAFLPKQKVGIVILQNAESSFGFLAAMQFFDWALGLPSKDWIK